MVDRQPSTIIIAPAGSKRYSKSRANSPSPSPTKGASSTRSRGKTTRTPAAGKSKGSDGQNDRLKAIRERREKLQAKIDKGKLPPLPPEKKSTSAERKKTPDQNSLSPNWKSKEQRGSKVATPPKISVPKVQPNKITIPTIRLTPLPVQYQVPRTKPSHQRAGSGSSHHDPLPDIRQDPSRPSTQERYHEEQLEMQREMQRQMQDLMRNQMQKLQHHFQQQQELQREAQQKEKEQLKQQLQEQQEEIERHKKHEETDDPKKEENKESTDQNDGDSKDDKGGDDEKDKDEKDEENGNSEDAKTPEDSEASEGQESKEVTKDDEKGEDEGNAEKADEKDEGKGNVEEEEEEDIGDVAEEVVEGMQDQNRKIQVANAEKARQLLSMDKPPVKQLIKAGILPVLIKCMERNDIPELQLEATWSVTNIASGASDHTWALVEAGAIPPLIDLMQNGKQNVREQAVWAIGNIIGDGPDCRNQAIKEGVVKPLVQLLSPAMPITLRRQVCWVLTNLFRMKNPDISEDDRKLCANALRDLVSHYDAQIQVDSLWATAYFADLGSDGIDDLLTCGIAKELVQRLYSNDEKVIAAALRATGTIVAGNNEQTDAVVEAGALPIYRELLKHPTPGIARETAWILSNITAGTPKQIQLVIDVQAVSALMAAAEKDDMELRKEATWALSNLTSGGTPTQIGVLVQIGVLGCLCWVLTDEESGMMVVALEAISNIFKKSEDDSQIIRCVEGVGGLKTLRNLQEHDQGEVAKLAKYLIETYFEEPVGEAEAEETEEA